MTYLSPQATRASAYTRKLSLDDQLAIFTLSHFHSVQPVLLARYFNVSRQTVKLIANVQAGPRYRYQRLREITKTHSREHLNNHFVTNDMIKGINKLAAEPSARPRTSLATPLPADISEASHAGTHRTAGAVTSTMAVIQIEWLDENHKRKPGWYYSADHGMTWHPKDGERGFATSTEAYDAALRHIEGIRE